MAITFDQLKAGEDIEGPKFAVSRESIRLFCDASLDHNPLHLDEDYMKGNFGRTNFGGIIMHGMNNFGLITRKNPRQRRGRRRGLRTPHLCGTYSAPYGAGPSATLCTPAWRRRTPE
jgi:hypothetical protein